MALQNGHTREVSRSTSRQHQWTTTKISIKLLIPTWNSLCKGFLLLFVFVKLGFGQMCFNSFALSDGGICFVHLHLVSVDSLKLLLSMVAVQDPFTMAINFTEKLKPQGGGKLIVTFFLLLIIGLLVEKRTLVR